jgi:hypothetical protein
VDLLSGLQCVPGHIVQLLLKILIRSGCSRPTPGFVLFARQSPYLLLHHSMVALCGQELLRLQVYDLSLQVDYLLWVLADHLHLSDQLGVLCYSHQYLMCLYEHLPQLVVPYVIFVEIDEYHDGALVFDGHQGRAGFH